ncbi:hypothetical protein QE152_g7121 [Popillia japonica]|uniref:Uncharacterized protein n=1 Tax=Popillia japonica TaxID=7064 RepID=A0AAW1MCJ3_POPJA
MRNTLEKLADRKNAASPVLQSIFPRNRISTGGLTLRALSSTGLYHCFVSTSAIWDVDIYKYYGITYLCKQ